jgi:hypothetical protein
MTRAREWAMGFAISTAVVMVAALLVGLYLVGLAWKRPPRMPGPPAPSITMADAALGYTMRPGLDVRLPVGLPPQSIGIATDRIGTRVAPADRGRDVPRDAILVGGDSQTFGWAVEYDESFPAQLSASLGVPVINGGVSGYGTTSIYRRMKALLAARA